MNAPAPASAPSPDSSAPRSARPARPSRLARFTHFALALLLAAAGGAWAQGAPLKFGVGLFQPDKDRNDATYRPLAQHLARALGREVKLYTVDTWEGLARSLASGETDLALMGPWGYVLAHHEAGAQAVATILYEGRPEYYAIMITHPKSGIRRIEDLKGRSFAFGDKGSTSGYLVPLHALMKLGIPDPEKYFSKVLHTKHQAIQLSVTRGELDAGADYNRNRDAMIAEGMVKAADSVVFWTSDPLPNDAFAVSAALHRDKALVARLQAALTDRALTAPGALPARYTGFVVKDNGFYKPIRDAGLATGKLAPR